MATKDERWAWTVDGFIREQNELLKLHIPTDINKLVYIFYKPEIRHFDKYNQVYQLFLSLEIVQSIH